MAASTLSAEWSAPTSVHHSYHAPARALAISARAPFGESSTSVTHNVKVENLAVKFAMVEKRRYAFSFELRKAIGFR